MEHTIQSLPKLGEDSVFICPSAQRVPANPAPDWLCYGPNYLLSINGTGNTTRPNLTNISIVREPNRLVLFAETTNHAPGSSFVAQNSGPQHLGNASAENTRHEGRTPVVFFDGHVEIFTTRELLQQSAGNINADFEHRVRWNPFHQ
jgi:prepilin-type processing-associated H-X9-DG protein